MYIAVVGTAALHLLNKWLAFIFNALNIFIIINKV